MKIEPELLAFGLTVFFGGVAIFVNRIMSKFDKLDEAIVQLSLAIQSLKSNS